MAFISDQELKVAQQAQSGGQDTPSATPTATGNLVGGATDFANKVGNFFAPTFTSEVPKAAANAKALFDPNGKINGTTGGNFMQKLGALASQNNYGTSPESMKRSAAVIGETLPWMIPVGKGAQALVTGAIRGSITPLTELSNESLGARLAKSGIGAIVGAPTEVAVSKVTDYLAHNLFGTVFPSTQPGEGFAASRKAEEAISTALKETKGVEPVSFGKSLEAAKNRYEEIINKAVESASNNVSSFRNDIEGKLNEKIAQIPGAMENVDGKLQPKPEFKSAVDQVMGWIQQHGQAAKDDWKFTPKDFNVLRDFLGKKGQFVDFSKANPTEQVANQAYGLVRDLLVKNTDPAVGEALNTVHQLGSFLEAVKPGGKGSSGFGFNPMMMALRSMKLIPEALAGGARAMNNPLVKQVLSATAQKAVSGDTGTYAKQQMPQIFGGQQVQPPAQGGQ